MNNDAIVDFMFGAGLGFVGVRSEGENQYLIYPSPPQNYGGCIEPLPEGYEIGTNSGSGELEWFGDGEGYDTLIICLSGSGGSACEGHFAGQRAYMGVEFQAADGIHYGWIDLVVSAYSPYAEIYGWAYETDPGMSINAGIIPEPSALFLVGVGSAALAVRWVKKKRRFTTK